MAMSKEHSAMIKRHLEEMAKAMPGEHIHMHSHEAGYTVHHVGEGGKHGPMEFPAMSGAKKQMAECAEGDCEG